MKRIAAALFLILLFVAASLAQPTTAGFQQPTPGPAINTTPETDAARGVAWSYQAGVAPLPKGVTVTWTLTKGPAGMSVNATGLVSWTPAVAGMFSAELRAKASTGNTATQTWKLTVQ